MEMSSEESVGSPVPPFLASLHQPSHFLGGCQCALRVFRPGDHLRDIVQMLRLIKKHSLCRCTAIRDRFHDLVMAVSRTSRLRKVRDAKYLNPLRQAGDFPRDLKPHFPADADIDLIKDQRLLGEQVRDHHLDGERDTGDLPPDAVSRMLRSGSPGFAEK